ncbi:hypothetical protein D6C82_09003 [Aureobasidium pullulans]|nr:hypothetical protein D6C82_09003 [Aureobasidium pullulans]
MKQDLLEQLDRTRLPELQFLSTYCPFTLNAKPCPTAQNAYSRKCATYVILTCHTSMVKH